MIVINFNHFENGNNKKNHQKIKIEANTSSNGSSTLSQLDGFEKQLKERELRVQQ